jgi:outer membrane lipoprotein-sorting protein
MLTRRQTPKKILVSCCALFLVASCSQSQRVATESNTNETIVSSTPPFQTREPDRYRATRTITTVTANGETTVEKSAVARDGELRREETRLTGQHVVFLYLPSGRFLLYPDEKLVVDLTRDNTETPGSENETESSPDRLLHTDAFATTYQKIGIEAVGGRTTQKFRVTVNGSTDANVSSNETTIWIDEALHMPIKTETNAKDGKRVTMELSDISLEVDQTLFRVPDGYQQIDLSEVRKRMKNSE